MQKGQHDGDLTFIVDVELVPRDDFHDLIGWLRQNDSSPDRK